MPLLKDATKGVSTALSFHSDIVLIVDLLISALIYLGTLAISVAYWIFDYLKQKATAALNGNSKPTYGGYGAVSQK